MRALRDPVTGCPWDVEQSFRSIARYTIEEAYEVLDAIERGDTDDIRDELGDLLLQVVFHAQIAQDQGLFDFSDVAAAIGDKMVRRHPHVFGAPEPGAAAGSAEAAREAVWEADKARARKQKGAVSVLDGVPSALPALTRADKLAKRAAQAGFDWTDRESILAKLHEELAEFADAVASGDPSAMEDEMGDILFVVCNLARHQRIDPEAALHRTNRKFTRRFQEIERLCRMDGRAVETLTLAELDRYWDVVKAAEKARLASV